jgi:hypothetical protein
LTFFAIKPCTSFKCLLNNNLATYTTMQLLILHCHFDPSLFHSLSLQTVLGGQGGVGGWMGSISIFEPKPQTP